MPALTEQRRKWQKEGEKVVERTTRGVGELKDRTEKGVRSGLQTVEEQTGLKVGDVVAAKDQAKAVVKDQMKAV